jgi:hypothetical protein
VSRVALVTLVTAASVRTLHLQQAVQQTSQQTEHARADSVSASAIDRVLSAGGVVNWKIVLTVLVLAMLAGAAVLIASEWRAVRKAGGLKQWVDDVPVVQYRTVRLIWLSEAVVVVLTSAVVSHAVWPQVVGEVQTDMVYAIFAFLGFGQGMNVTAFLGKRATEDPVVTATNAAIADPTVQPVVTSNKKTGERTVTTVPSAPATTTQTMAVPAAAPDAATATFAPPPKPAPVVVTVVTPPAAPVARDA